MTQRFDVAGSGFGGSILACRLAQAARSVSVLERDRRWNATDFPRSPAGSRASIGDARGQLHDLVGVQIGDASAFPTATGVNPMVAVMALADRKASDRRSRLPRRTYHNRVNVIQ